MKRYTTAERLKQIMRMKKMRQVDILEKCKPYCEEYGIRIGRNDLSQYVSGKVEPGQEKLTILAKALNASESWLMGYEVPLLELEDESLESMINTRIKELKMPLDEVADKAGVPLYWLQNIDTFVPGEWGNEHDIGYVWITQVADVLGLPSNALRTALARQEVPTYDGPSITAEEAFSGRNLSVVPVAGENKNPLTPIHYKKQIPILGRISAGLPVLAVEHIESYENVEDESLDYGLVVKGDSMIGARIFEDDVVYVARDCCIENGDIVIALINGDDATIKRFYKYDNEIILKPENPTMKEQHYKPEEVQILGKVKEAKIKLK